MFEPIMLGARHSTQYVPGIRSDLKRSSRVLFLEGMTCTSPEPILGVGTAGPYRSLILGVAVLSTEI